MLIARKLYPLLEKQLKNVPKIILIYGPRQAGKTTLIKQIISGKVGVVLFNGDDIRTQELFSVANLGQLQAGIGNAHILVIDEAQRIPDIGLSLKLLHDENPSFPIIASGSSSFDLANRVNEPLTGRTATFTLYPFSFLEVPVRLPDVSITARLEEFLMYGLYPEAVTTVGETEKQNYLNELISTYLYRDILTFETVRKPKKVIDLLTLLALQIGNEVSIQELAQNLTLSKTIVEKYLDILEKMFIIVNIRGFSRNLRKEISKTSKYYFVDLGLRNALIRNFNPLHLRDDAGHLFENLCIIERIKALSNKREPANMYFWRTYDQKEIDVIEERGGNLYAYECKFSQTDHVSSSAAREFLSTYPTSVFKTVTPVNFVEFLAS